MKGFAKLCLAAALLFATAPSFAQKNIPLVYDQEFTGKNFPAPEFPTVETAKEVKTLPDPFEFSNGKKRVKSFKDWERRRSEIVRELYHYEVGEKPMTPKDNISARLDGNNLVVTISRNGESLEIKATITYPDGDGPFPLMIGCSGVGLLPGSYFKDNGIATLSYNFGQVMAHQQKRGSEPVNKIYPELVENGAYSMWPWGVSRIIDGLEILGAKARIDMKHIGITGCSFAGKMALWSGAFDERIALVIAQEPGGGGADAWRVSETLGHVETLGNTDHHWFMEKMWDFQGEKTALLPYDHHELAALVCPRALLILGNTDFEWLAEEANYAAAVAAREVWKKFGIEDRMGYSIQGGHGHCALPRSQYPEVQAFIEKFLLGNNDANTIIMHVDEKLADKDVQKWIAPWAGK